MSEPKGKSLEERAGKLLTDKSLTVACAESCTGGLLTSLLTDVPGSSRYVKGSVTAYTNEVKRAALGVASETLDKYGAISAKTAEEMANGVRRFLDADVGLATTGNAGPSADEDKPVGLVYVAVSFADKVLAIECRFNGTRTDIKKQAANAALLLLIENLNDKGETP